MHMLQRRVGGKKKKILQKKKGVFSKCFLNPSDLSFTLLREKNETA